MVVYSQPPVFEFERSRDNPNYLDHAVMDIGALAAMVANGSVDNDAIYSWIKVELHVVCCYVSTEVVVHNRRRCRECACCML